MNNVFQQVTPEGLYSLVYEHRLAQKSDMTKGHRRTIKLKTIGGPFHVKYGNAVYLFGTYQRFASKGKESYKFYGEKYYGENEYDGRYSLLIAPTKDGKLSFSLGKLDEDY